MRDGPAIAQRLRDWQAAQGLKNKDTQQALGWSSSKWSQYIDLSGERPIPVKEANKLCDKYGLTLDWIYRGNPAYLPHELRLKIEAIERARQTATDAA